MTLALLLVLGSCVAVGLLIGLLAKMPPVELAAMCGLMCAAALGMHYLVSLIG